MGRKLIKIGCSFLMAITVFFNAVTPIAAEERNTGGADIGNVELPYRAQLDDNATIFYSALETLYKNGDMKTGVGTYDLSTSFTQEVLKNYANGDSFLAKAFQSARDAFVMDYPEIFYVDFTKVTLRLGMKDGSYVLYVNNGSYENYYTSSFTSKADVEAAIALVNEKKSQLKAGISDITLENPASIITAFHNAIIEQTEYTYPSKDNRDVSNVYGALVNGTANCDGYSRTLKWLLDDYDIENILVVGVGKNARYEDNDDVENFMNEYHQWNYVKLEDKWYAVDVTWDDPIKVGKATDTIRTTYLLRGSDMLNENHFPMGFVSEESQEFIYPQLENLDYGVLAKDENVDLGDISTDLKVYISKEEFPGHIDDEGNMSKGTRYTANYKNMTYEQLAQQGLYVAVRFGLSNTDFGPWEHLDAFPNDANMDPKNLFDFTVFTKTTIQFCITKIDQPENEIDYGSLDLSQEGNHVVLTKAIDAPYYENYTPQPFIRTSFPALTQRIMPKKTHYKVEYYEELEVIDEAKEVSIKINNTAAHIDAKVENITSKNSTYLSPSGKEVISTIVEFDFTPDSTFQGYENVYRLQIENMQGVNSKKLANDIPIITTYDPKLPCPMVASAGGPNSAFVMSNPKLVVNEDMSNTMFQDKDGNELKYGNLNIALVATKTTGSDKEDLDNVLGNLMNGSKASSTFELSLGCGSIAAALRPGYNVSVGVPYPEGFHPEDYKDVEFRAYHFKMVDGKWVSEEIICQVTPQGLMIIADSFSPFTIVAYDKEDAPASTLSAKTVNVSAETAGGSISTDKGGIGTYAVLDNDSRTFSVTPDEGYMIDKIIVNNTEVKVSDKTSYTATFDNETMENSNEMKVFFVAEKVVEEEKQNKIEAITPVILPEEVVNNQPVYVNRPMQAETVEKVAIKASGIFLQDANLVLEIKALSKEAAASFATYEDNVEFIASGTPNLTINGAFKGDEIRYEIPVNTTSKVLTFLTYDTSKNDYVEATAQVNKGIASVTASGLVEFALLKESDSEVNKTALQSAYDTAVLLVKTDFTSASWNVFKEKLDAAKVVLDNTEATQKEVNDAKLALAEAVEQLIELGDKAKLQTAYNIAILLVETDYTATSWNVFKDKRTAVKSVLDNATATQKDVDDALTGLSEAQAALVKRANKDMLRTLIETAKEEKERGVYTSTSLQVLEEALASANAILNDVNATEASVIEVYKELEVAIDQLVELGDKTVLSELLKQANALDLSKYTDTSVKVLMDSLKEAQNVLDNNDATQEQIEGSIKVVQSAMNALENAVENKPAGDSGESGENSEGTTNGSSDTGDSSNVVLWGSLLTGSACLLLLGLRKLLRKK